MRGYHWKGRDCFPFDDELYPGRKVHNYSGDSDFEIDYNCNGIFGKDPATN